jgi:hypothetical protein
MSDIRNGVLLKDRWAQFNRNGDIHPSLKKFLSHLRLELFFDEEQEGPTFIYEAKRWRYTKENVGNRLEYLAGLFEECAAELEALTEEG